MFICGGSNPPGSKMLHLGVYSGNNSITECEGDCDSCLQYRIMSMTEALQSQLENANTQLQQVEAENYLLREKNLWLEEGAMTGTVEEALRKLLGIYKTGRRTPTNSSPLQTPASYRAVDQASVDRSPGSTLYAIHRSCITSWYSRFHLSLSL